MISMIRGRLSWIEENKVEIDTGGIGYEVFVPTSLIPELPPKGSEVELYTHLNVKEDEMSLFGFPTRDELRVFKLLIAVSGIGPKGAIGLLSAMKPDDLRLAVLSDDAKSIAKAPGIGKKTAERLIIELRDKFGRDDEVRAFGQELLKSSGPVQNDLRQDTVLALMELGFSTREAYLAVQNLDFEGQDAGALLKQALKQLGR